MTVYTVKMTEINLNDLIFSRIRAHVNLMQIDSKQTYLLIKFVNEINLNKFINIKKSLRNKLEFKLHDS